MSSSIAVDVEPRRPWSTQDLMWWVALLSLHFGTLVVCLRWFAPPVELYQALDMRMPSVTKVVLALRDGMEEPWLRMTVIALIALLCWFLAWIRRRFGVADLAFVGAPLIAGTSIIPVVFASGLAWRKPDSALNPGGSSWTSAGAGWLEICAWQ